MTSRENYEAALELVRRQLGSGFAVVPVYPDHRMICAALDHWDKVGRDKQSYSDIYAVMVNDYVRRKK